MPVIQVGYRDRFGAFVQVPIEVSWSEYLVSERQSERGERYTPDPGPIPAAAPVPLAITGADRQAKDTNQKEIAQYNNQLAQVNQQQSEVNKAKEQLAKYLERPESQYDRASVEAYRRQIAAAQATVNENKQRLTENRALLDVVISNAIAFGGPTDAGAAKFSDPTYIKEVVAPAQIEQGRDIARAAIAQGASSAEVLQAVKGVSGKVAEGVRKEANEQYSVSGGFTVEGLERSRTPEMQAVAKQAEINQGEDLASNAILQGLSDVSQAGGQPLTPNQAVGAKKAIEQYRKDQYALKGGRTEFGEQFFSSPEMQQVQLAAEVERGRQAARNALLQGGDITVRSERELSGANQVLFQAGLELQEQLDEHSRRSGPTQAGFERFTDPGYIRDVIIPSQEARGYDIMRGAALRGDEAIFDSEAQLRGAERFLNEVSRNYGGPTFEGVMKFGDPGYIASVIIPAQKQRQADMDKGFKLDIHRLVQEGYAVTLNEKGEYIATKGGEIATPLNIYEKEFQLYKAGKKTERLPENEVAVTSASISRSIPTDTRLSLKEQFLDRLDYVPYDWGTASIGRAGLEIGAEVFGFGEALGRGFLFGAAMISGTKEVDVFGSKLHLLHEGTITVPFGSGGLIGQTSLFFNKKTDVNAGPLALSTGKDAMYAYRFPIGAASGVFLDVIALKGLAQLSVTGAKGATRLVKGFVREMRAGPDLGLLTKSERLAYEAEITARQTFIPPWQEARRLPIREGQVRLGKIGLDIDLGELKPRPPLRDTRLSFTDKIRKSWKEAKAETQSLYDTTPEPVNRKIPELGLAKAEPKINVAKNISSFDIGYEEELARQIKISTGEIKPPLLHYEDMLGARVKTFLTGKISDIRAGAKSLGVNVETGLLNVETKIGASKTAKAARGAKFSFDMNVSPKLGAAKEAVTSRVESKIAKGKASWEYLKNEDSITKQANDIMYGGSDVSAGKAQSIIKDASDIYRKRPTLGVGEYPKDILAHPERQYVELNRRMGFYTRGGRKLSRAAKQVDDELAAKLESGDLDGWNRDVNRIDELIREKMSQPKFRKVTGGTESPSKGGILLTKLEDIPLKPKPKGRGVFVARPVDLNTPVTLKDLLGLSGKTVQKRKTVTSELNRLNQDLNRSVNVTVTKETPSQASKRKTRFAANTNLYYADAATMQTLRTTQDLTRAQKSDLIRRFTMGQPVRLDEITGLKQLQKQVQRQTQRQITRQVQRTRQTTQTRQRTGLSQRSKQAQRFSFDQVHDQLQLQKEMLKLQEMQLHKQLTDQMQTTRIIPPYKFKQTVKGLPRYPYPPDMWLPKPKRGRRTSGDIYGHKLLKHPIATGYEGLFGRNGGKSTAKRKARKKHVKKASRKT